MLGINEELRAAVLDEKKRNSNYLLHLYLSLKIARLTFQTIPDEPRERTSSLPFHEVDPVVEDRPHTEGLGSTHIHIHRRRTGQL